MKNKINFLAISFFIVAITTVIFTTCKKAPVEIYGHINGTVFEEGTTTPIQGVTIILAPTGTTKTTGSDGKFEFKNLEAKEFNLQASKSGFVDNTKTIAVAIGEDTKADISLRPDNFPPTLTTANPVIIYYAEATVEGNLTDLGSGNITSHGHVWSTSPSPTTSVLTKVDYGTTDKLGAFNSTLTNLVANTKYYIRAYATNNAGTGYSLEVSFTTPPELSTPTVTTTDISIITETGATGGGNVLNVGTSAVSARGICWNTSGNPTTSDTHTSDGTGAGSFISNLYNLTASTLYYVRAYAVNSDGTAYGETKQFTAEDIPVPLAVTQAASSIGQSDAVLNANINANGYETIVTFEYGTSTSYGNSVSAVPGTITSTVNTNVSADISGLSESTTYHFRVKAVNDGGTTYGADMEFTTSELLFPTVLTGNITNIENTVAVGGGNVTNSGVGAVSERGVCINTSGNPTISNTTFSGGSGTGSFTCYMSGLTAGTRYYIKAFATNGQGTAYGEEKDFTTTSAIPSVTVLSASNILQTTATLNGQVNANNYDATVIFEYGLSPSYGNTINANPNVVSGNSNVSISANLSSLTYNTLYHYRIKAVNSGGTTYSNDMTFTTLDLMEGTVVTEGVTDINYFSATCGGNITSDGGLNITNKGVCWNTSANPTTSDNITTDGSGTSSFTSSLTNLNENTTYYVKAYVTNSIGTSYGEQEIFTTLDATEPTLTTNIVSGIKITSATVGGNIIDENGYSVTEKGVCWSTGQNPTISDNNINILSSSFSDEIDLLDVNTTYYVRAYATNSIGTGYGQQEMFTTAIPPTNVTDYDGNVYNVILIGNQLWMKENLKVTHYPNGTVIPLITDETDWSNASLIDDAYCFYNNNASSVYGALYKWPAAMNHETESNGLPSGVQGVCPNGWHLPSKREFDELSDYIGGSSVAGGKLKEVGTSHWLSPNTGATNESEFTALPGGMRNGGGVFYESGYSGFWWCTSKGSYRPNFFKLYKDAAYSEVGDMYGSNGLSVRCVMD